MLNTLSILSMDQGKITKSVAGFGSDERSDEDVLAAARQSGRSWAAVLWGRVFGGMGVGAVSASHVVQR